MKSSTTGSGYVNYPQGHLEMNMANTLVFVGCGLVAPEYGWDDYKGVDVRGKTVVFLVNDPQIPDPRDASKRDAALSSGSFVRQSD